jgi:hypothetical protein
MTLLVRRELDKKRAIVEIIRILEIGSKFFSEGLGGW